MAQMEQTDTGRNTKLASGNKARNWCFTLNNYTQEDIDTLTQAFSQKKCKYVFQEEVGENKTEHLQGLVCFPNAVSFNTIKKIIPKGHIEQCKNKIASVQYCTKEETREGEIYTNMDIENVEKTSSGTKPPHNPKRALQETVYEHDKTTFGTEYANAWKKYTELKEILVNLYEMKEEEAILKSFRETFIEKDNADQ
ncbi:MAG: putative viral replication protein [Cressdnaviricota sp.]|nr:MAG: putative viral replication protein [Cressdnaviricota sp.]